MAEKQRILIVDDDANIAELISLYLTKECFETQIVEDGEEALKAFPVFKPNLAPPPRCPSSCSPPRERFSTRCWGWSWGPTTT